MPWGCTLEELTLKVIPLTPVMLTGSGDSSVCGSVNFLFLQIPTTVPKPFNLGLNKRVEERQQYRHGVAQRQRDSDARAKVFKDEEVERERRELKEYRKSLVFKVRNLYIQWSLSTRDKLGVGPFVPCREVVLFLEVTNVLSLWEV